MSVPDGHPAPQETARPIRPGEGPQTIRTLIQAASKAGWESRATYARGNTLDKNGETGALVESIMVRTDRGDEHATALWLRNLESQAQGGPAWKFVGGWVWLSHHWLPSKVGSRALTALIKADALDFPVPGWSVDDAA